jgi:hypothetical protein
MELHFLHNHHYLQAVFDESRYLWNRSGLTRTIQVGIILSFVLVGFSYGYSLSIITSGDVILENERIHDLVVIDGTVQIHNAVIDGQVYTLDCHVTISGNTIILGLVTINQGILRMEDLGTACHFAGEIMVLNGVFIHNDTSIPIINQAKTLEIPCGRGYAKISLYPTPISDHVAQTTRRYLLFPRYTLPANVSAIAQNLPSLLGLELTSISDEASQLFLADDPQLARIQLNPSFIEAARVIRWESSQIRVVVQLIRFNTSLLAEQFWIRLMEFPTRYLNASFISTFGDGAHWFFRFQKKLAAYWYQERSFIGVTCQFVEGNITVPQAETFRDQILEELTSHWNINKG